VLHAGTARDRQGRLVTAGGRVLAVTAVADTVADARESAYRAVEHIRIPGSHHRRDIAATA
jgi:phosphoribosylamine--glycine ligase